MILITLVLLTVILFAYKVYKVHHYWTDKHVPQGSLLFTLRGHFEIFAKTEDVFSRFVNLYKKFENKRYFGVYFFGSPMFMIRDPDLIKEITVKSFDHFPNHSFYLADQEDLWSNNLFALRDQKWREMRATISPVFTTSKIKQMFVLIDEISQQFCNFFLKQDKSLITIEMKDTFTRFTNDVIASTAFGIQCNSLEEPNNEFYRMGVKVTSLGPWRAILMMLLFAAPKVFKFFKIGFFPADVSEFFKKLIAANVEERERKGIVRPDLIQLLMDANKGNLKFEDEDGGENEHIRYPKKEFSITEMTAQALIFFFAGFESVSILLCFTAYELAINPDVQERLRNEIDACDDEKPTYETINKMKYLDMVISESLRKWPVNGGVDRSCSKAFTIEATTPDEQPVVIEQGVNIWYHIVGLHRDPQYFPDPERFDPERFSDENKANIKPFTYLPFGAGPRSCIGSRFALIEAKIIFFHILRNFEIVPVAKTEIPLKISKRSFSITAANGFWLGLKRRK